MRCALCNHKNYYHDELGCVTCNCTSAFGTDSVQKVCA